MRRLGILPAAGKGTRWGGYPKFALPCGENEYLLDRAIKGFPCDDVVIVYSDYTFTPIVNHLARTDLLCNVQLVENKRMDLDFYGSMLAAMEIEADYYYFAMPDTYIDTSVFKAMKGNICLGVFHTEEPERFGVIRNGQIINKTAGNPGFAWGCLGWSKEVRDLWRCSFIETYTQAINLALQEFRAKTVNMSYYYDMANFEHYADFIKETA